MKCTEVNKPLISIDLQVTVYFAKDLSDTQIREFVERLDDYRYISYNRASKLLSFRIEHFSTLIIRTLLEQNDNK